jgi:uncharacterized protein with FMN-binding domain
MLSFELSAIDIILVISVVVLFILYITKMQARNYEEELPRQPKVNTVVEEKPAPASVPHGDYTECPRGFGSIRKLGEDNSVSEKCLGCYRIMECYNESE